MVGGDVEGLEVVPVRLGLGALGHGESHADEDVLQLGLGLGHEVEVPGSGPGQHLGQEDHHRENTEAEDERRVGNRSHDFAAHLVFMFEEPGQVSHHRRKDPRLFSHPNDADVKLAEQPGMFL